MLVRDQFETREREKINNVQHSCLETKKIGANGLRRNLDELN